MNERIGRLPWSALPAAGAAPSKPPSPLEDVRRLLARIRDEKPDPPHVILHPDEHAKAICGEAFVDVRGVPNIWPGPAIGRAEVRT